MMDPPHISSSATECFYLSGFSRDDLSIIVNSLQNPSIANNLARVPSPYTTEHALAWFDSVETQDPETADIRWAIRSNSTRKMIGMIGLHYVDKTCYRLGYWLREEKWGRGITTTAISQVLEFVKVECPYVRRLVSGVKERNTASRRVLEKNGFHETRSSMHDGFGNVVFFELTM